MKGLQSSPFGFSPLQIIQRLVPSIILLLFPFGAASQTLLSPGAGLFYNFDARGFTVVAELTAFTQDILKSPSLVFDCGYTPIAKQLSFSFGPEVIMISCGPNFTFDPQGFHIGVDMQLYLPFPPIPLSPNTSGVVYTEWDHVFGFNEKDRNGIGLLFKQYPVLYSVPGPSGSFASPRRLRSID